MQGLRGGEALKATLVQRYTEALDAMKGMQLPPPEARCILLCF
jgi:hypothetical protein